MKLFNRRDAIRGASKGIIGASSMATAPALLWRCSSMHSDAFLKQESKENELSSIDPIEDIQVGTSDFYTGDDPISSHGLLRDVNFDELLKKLGVEREETAQIVIVGGGIAGLASGYLLRDLNPIIMEHRPRFGGNAMGERWNGIEYALGSAYFAKLDSNHIISKQIYDPLGLSKVWKACPESSAIVGNVLLNGFWSGNGIADAKSKAQVLKFRDYIKSVIESDEYPEIPPLDFKMFSQHVLDLDQFTFIDHLKSVLSDEPTTLTRSVLEHYCWSSLNMTMDDVSAAAAINFMAGDSEGLFALPAGNAKMASMFLNEIARASNMNLNPLRTNCPVLKIRKNGNFWDVFSLGSNGKFCVTRTKSVVMAAPKFIASRIVDSLLPDQSDAIKGCYLKNLGPYLVANVLIDAPCPTTSFDTFIVGDSEDFSHLENGATISKSGPTDFVIGQFAQGGHPSKTVLTLYHGLPFIAAQHYLMLKKGDPQSQKHFANDRDFLAKKAQGICSILGIKSNIVPEQIRVNRFGHPMINAIAGIYRSGDLQLASRPIGSNFYWANQDNWGIPGIESSLTSAIYAADGVRRGL